MNVGITLSYDPSGKVVNATATSSDPRIQKMYAAMDLKTLIQNAQASGSGSLYGQPLVVGQPTVSDTTTSMDGMMKAMTGMMGAGQATSMQGLNMQAKPLTMHTTVKYLGKDGDGNLNFDQALSIDPWQLDMSTATIKMKMQVLNVVGGGKSTLRPDGMNKAVASKQDMTMQVQLDMPGEPYRMTMKVKFGVTSSTALKNITLP